MKLPARNQRPFPPTRARLVLCLSALVVGSAGSLAAQTDDQIGIARGASPAPVVIEDLDGIPVDLSEWIGDGPLLVEFWATWCEICEALHPQMQEAHRQFGDRVRFVAIAVAVGQSQRTIQRHLEQRPVAYPTLWDTEGRAVRAFMAPLTSYIVILDEDGRVAYTGAGRDQDVAGAIEDVLSGG